MELGLRLFFCTFLEKKRWRPIKRNKNCKPKTQVNRKQIMKIMGNLGDFKNPSRKSMPPKKKTPRSWSRPGFFGPKDLPTTPTGGKKLRSARHCQRSGRHRRPVFRPKQNKRRWLSHPSEKYARLKLDHFRRDPGENDLKKYIKNHHRGKNLSTWHEFTDGNGQEKIEKNLLEKLFLEKLFLLKTPSHPVSPSNTWAKPHGPSEWNTRSRGHGVHLHQPKVRQSSFLRGKVVQGNVKADFFTLESMTCIQNI